MEQIKNLRERMMDQLQNPQKNPIAQRPATTCQAERDHWAMVQSLPSHAATKRDNMPGRRDCTQCHGAGYVRYNVPQSDPRFGRALPCGCRMQEIDDYNAALKRNAATGKFAPTIGLSLDQLKNNGNGTNAMMTASKRVLAGELFFLTLSGGYGVGKTHVLHAIANACGRQVVVGYTATILQWLRDGYNDSSVVGFDERWAQIMNAECLCLDEFTPPTALKDHDARIKNSEWANERMAELVNHRYELAKQRVAITVLATNQDPKNWQGYYADRVTYGGGRSVFSVVYNQDDSMRKWSK